MQNTNLSELKYCIVKTPKEFEQDIQKAFKNAKVKFKYSAENGITIIRENDFYTVPDTDVCEILSLYYCTKILSFHSDNSEDKNVWIVCQDIEKDIYQKIKIQYDTEDVIHIINEEYDTEWMDNTARKDFFKAIDINQIVDTYQSKADAEYGTWDNIRSILNSYYKEKIESVLNTYEREWTLKDLTKQLKATQKRLRQLENTTLHQSCEKKPNIPDDDKTDKLYEKYKKLVTELLSAKTELLNAKTELLNAKSEFYQYMKNTTDLNATDKSKENITKNELSVEEDYFDKSVNTLDLSTRAARCLRREGITTIGQLIKLTESDLMKIRHFGNGCLIETRKKLKLHYNASLKGE